MPLQPYGRYTGGLQAANNSRYIVLLACLAACSAPAPAPVKIPPDAYRELKWFQPPPLPLTSAGETDDEAEIQYRAAFPFYRSGRWQYAAAALAEALDYDESRADIRYFLLVSLLMAGRGGEIPTHLQEFAPGPLEQKVRLLAAIALLRTGAVLPAREIILPAAIEDYEAFGWLARLDALEGRRPGSDPSLPMGQ